MSPALAAQHLALDALTDPITPLPVMLPAKAPVGAAGRPRAGAADFLCGFAVATVVAALVALHNRFARATQQRHE